LKIAVSAEGPTLDAKVGSRFGTSGYMLIVDLQTMKLDPVPLGAGQGQRGGGMQAVVAAIGHRVKVVLTGYCGPQALAHLSDNGIKVIDGLEGTVIDVIDTYRREELSNPEIGYPDLSRSQRSRSGRIQASLYASAKQFGNILPIMAGVILLMGLFSALVSKTLITMVFSGKRVLDNLWGACLGSILAGNPINSYIIGSELLDQGVGLVAVTSFMVAWVSVGLVQLPAEMASLGVRFALIRNLVAFVFSMIIASLTVFISHLITV